jgi:hypothetical protein
MLIERVSAHIRFSQDTGQGWKTVELGAEAHIEPAEDWALAQQGLYAMLTVQLRQLWPQNGVAPEHAQNGTEKAVEPGSWEELEASPSPKSQEHYCAEHGTAFRKYEKDGKFWFSHKQGDNWCREQPARGWRNG